MMSLKVKKKGNITGDIVHKLASRSSVVLALLKHSAIDMVSISKSIMSTHAVTTATDEIVWLEVSFPQNRSTLGEVMTKLSFDR